jgi:ATP-binding cassette, subfamily B, beta-glucan exporter
MDVRADNEGSRGSALALARTYLRALALLRAERGAALALAAANVALALVQLAEPVLFGAVVDSIDIGGAVFQLIALWALLGLGGIVAGVVVSLHADRLAHRRRTAAMADAFERVVTLPVGYHARAGSGRLIRTLVAGTDALFLVWLGFLREHLAALVGVALLIPTALATDARLAGVLALLAAAYVGVSLFVVRRTQAGQRAVERHHQDVFGHVGDVIGNVAVVQSYGRPAAEASALQELMRRLLAAQLPVLAWWAALTILTRASATVVMVAIFAAGALLARAHQVSLGEIVSFVGFAGLLIARLDQITGFVGRLFVQAPTVDAFFDILAEREAVREAPGARALGPVEGRVAFEGVTYRFPGSAQGVFDLSFEVPPGRTVALVGPTGSGKTTTLALLQRLRDPDAGRITIDGTDIREATLASLRHATAVVFQEAGLFNRSIRDNLLVGRPDATDAEVEDAARRAEAHDFIAEKPGGYDFVIGERGRALSGGERQRLAIARALLKDAPILLLDEATSALDVGTEGRIKRALDAARRGRTTFVIAHRLSTIVDADLVVVLERGRIVERGRFGELAAGDGPFSRLVAEGRLAVPA